MEASKPSHNIKNEIHKNDREITKRGKLSKGNKRKPNMGVFKMVSNAKKQGNIFILFWSFFWMRPFLREIDCNELTKNRPTLKSKNVSEPLTPPTHAFCIRVWLEKALNLKYKKNQILITTPGIDGAESDNRTEKYASQWCISCGFITYPL